MTRLNILKITVADILFFWVKNENGSELRKILNNI